MTAKKKKSEALNEVRGVDAPSSLSTSSAKHIQQKRLQKTPVSEIIKGLLEGDKVMLSRAITIIESSSHKHQKQAQEIIEACLPHANNSIRIGITGVPGAGKSTFIESFGKMLTAKDLKVAVLAVDPSSTISKGSILGDKTRMEELVKEENAFIRPSSSGDSLGGVAKKTRETIILCEAAGFETIIIETVGVGQSETAVHSMTDFFLLLKLAGAGDELQGMKRGIVEMADLIVINKADGENIKAARLARTEFNRALHLYPPKESNWTPKAISCSALKNEGIAEIYELITNYISLTKDNGFFEARRRSQNKFWLLQTIENRLKKDFYDRPVIKKELEKQLQAIEKNETTPFEAAARLLALEKDS